LLPEFGEEEIVTTIKKAQDGMPECWKKVDKDPKYKDCNLTPEMVSKMKDDFKTIFNSYGM